MYTLDFTSSAKRVMAKWKKSNPSLFKKLCKVLLSIQENPRYGIGHPEPLVRGGNVTYSRHISAHDRIIYDIYDAEVRVLVIEVEGHYDDK